MPSHDTPSAPLLPEFVFMSAATAPNQQPATSTETDPEALGWMKGLPPAPDRTITFQNGSFRSFPEKALGLEQRPPVGADGECLARSRACVGAAA